MKDFKTPFKIIGNLYFVGTYPASSHMIVTEEGLMLIDTGYPETADIVLSSVKTLGFDIADLKYIILSHGHIDHLGGAKKLAELTGAKTILGEADKTYADGTEPLTWAKELGREYNEAFTPDILLHDGDVISLGSTRVKCISTPGHTPGTFSFFFDVTENGKTYRVGTFGGTGINSLKKSFLEEYSLPYSLRKDFLNSIDRLLKEHVDVFIGNHFHQNKSLEKYEKIPTSSVNPFIDASEWALHLVSCRERLYKLLQDEGCDRIE